VDPHERRVDEVSVTRLGHGIFLSACPS
jgi:hypothetical protein